MTPIPTYEEVLQYIKDWAEKFGINIDENATEDSPIIDCSDGDSLDLVELIMDVEDHYNIDIDDDFFAEENYSMRDTKVTVRQTVTKIVELCATQPRDI